MAIEAHPYLRRAAEGAGWFLLCLPLLLASLVLSGGTSSPAPSAVALAATVYLVTAGVARMGRRYALAVAIGVFLVVASTLFDTARVESEEDLAHARFGLPFDYVEAELTVTPPFPYEAGWNPWEDGARLLILRFLAAVLVAATLAVGLVASGRMLLPRDRT